MSQELDAPKMPTGTYPELSPNPNSEGLKLKDGGRGTPVVVNTEPRQANTNTITVNEVKRLIREAIDHFEKEEGGVTEEEMEEYVDGAIAIKATVHTFEEGTVLTDAILAKVKSGDILKMANMEFVVNNKVNQSPRSITGAMVGVINSSYVTVIKLNWEKGEALEPELVTMNAGTKLYKHTFLLETADHYEYEFVVLSPLSTKFSELDSDDAAEVALSNSIIVKIRETSASLQCIPSINLSGAHTIEIYDIGSQNTLSKKELLFTREDISSEVVSAY